MGNATALFPASTSHMPYQTGYNSSLLSIATMYCPGSCLGTGWAPRGIRCQIFGRENFFQRRGGRGRERWSLWFLPSAHESPRWTLLKPYQHDKTHRANATQSELSRAPC